MKTFYALLANAFAASLTNTFVWFALTFWVYLETQSVVATSMMAGVYTVTVAVSGFFWARWSIAIEANHNADFKRLFAAVLYHCLQHLSFDVATDLDRSCQPNTLALYRARAPWCHCGQSPLNRAFDPGHHP